MECWRLRLRGANIGGNVILKLPKAGHTTLDELKDLVAESVQQGLDSLVIKAGFPPKELSSDGGPDAIISKLGVADAETLIVDWPAGTGAGEMARGSGAAEVVGRSEGRSRKPQKVVKMVSGQSSSGRPQPAATSAQQQQARSQEPASATETLPGQKRAPAQAPAKSQKKPKASSSKSAPTQRTGLEFESASSAFDPADVAGAFMRNDFGEGRDSLGEVAFDQFASAARLHALETGKVEVKEEQEEGALKLVVEYSGNNKKKYTDCCRGYSAEEITSTFRAILSYNQSSSRGRATSAKHLLTPLKLSERYPPLLWSIYWTRKVSAKLKGARELEELVKSFVAQAEAP